MIQRQRYTGLAREIHMQNRLVLRVGGVAYCVIQTQTPPYHLDPTFIVRIVLPTLGHSRLAQAKILGVWDGLSNRCHRGDLDIIEFTPI